MNTLSRLAALTLAIAGAMASTAPEALATLSPASKGIEQKGLETPGDADAPLEVVQASAASFECRTTDGIHYTVALRSSGTASDPIIVWTSDAFTQSGFPPSRRCLEVTDRLNRVLRNNGNSLAGLYLTVGRVNGQSVVCSVGSIGSGCNSRNVLFTLSGENARYPNEVLLGLRDRAASGGYIPTAESGGQVFVELEALVNQHF